MGSPAVHPRVTSESWGGTWDFGLTGWGGVRMVLAVLMLVVLVESLAEGKQEPQQNPFISPIGIALEIQ